MEKLAFASRAAAHENKSSCHNLHLGLPKGVPPMAAKQFSAPISASVRNSYLFRPARRLKSSIEANSLWPRCCNKCRRMFLAHEFDNAKAKANGIVRLNRAIQSERTTQTGEF